MTQSIVFPSQQCAHIFRPANGIVAEEFCARGCGTSLAAVRSSSIPMPVDRGELLAALAEAQATIKQLANAAVGPTSFADAEQCVQFVVFFASRLEMPDRARFVNSLGEAIRPLMVPPAVPPTSRPAPLEPIPGDEHDALLVAKIRALQEAPAGPGGPGSLELQWAWEALAKHRENQGVKVE